MYKTPLRLSFLVLLITACSNPTAAPPATVTPFLLATAAPVTATGAAPAASVTPAAPAATPTLEAACLGYVTLDAPTAALQAALGAYSAEQGWTFQAEPGEAALTSLAQAGVPVLVAEGAALAAATRAAAEAFPNTYFIGLDQTGAEPAREDQVGFVAGAIAGLITQGEIVTAIGLPATPVGLKYRNGFLHGVRYTCTRCRVDFVDSVDGASDAAAVAERARLNASLSSDVVFAAAGEAGRQGLLAAAAQGAWLIGIDPADAAAFAPGQPGAEQWVTSVYFDRAAAVLAALRAHQQGAPLAGALPWSIAAGALVIEPYNVSEEILDPLDRQVLDTLLLHLADGRLETGIDPLSGQER